MARLVVRCVRRATHDRILADERYIEHYEEEAPEVRDRDRPRKSIHCKRLARLAGRCCCVSPSRYAIYAMPASVAAPLCTQDPLYSNPFAFRTVRAAGAERNVTSALATSI